RLLLSLFRIYRAAEQLGGYFRDPAAAPAPPGNGDGLRGNGDVSTGADLGTRAPRNPDSGSGGVNRAFSSAVSLLSRLREESNGSGVDPKHHRIPRGGLVRPQPARRARIRSRERSHLDECIQ